MSKWKYFSECLWFYDCVLVNNIGTQSVFKHDCTLSLVTAFQCVVRTPVRLKSLREMDRNAGSWGLPQVICIRPTGGGAWEPALQGVPLVTSALSRLGELLTWISRLALSSIYKVLLQRKGVLCMHVYTAKELKILYITICSQVKLLLVFKLRPSSSLCMIICSFRAIKRAQSYCDSLNFFFRLFIYFYCCGYWKDRNNEL